MISETDLDTSSDDEITLTQRIKNLPQEKNQDESSDDQDDVPLAVRVRNRRRVKNHRKKRSRASSTWQSGHLKKSAAETFFRGNEELPQDLTDYKTPSQFFNFLFTKEMIQHITEQSNLYSVQCRPEKPTNIQEL